MRMPRRAAFCPRTTIGQPFADQVVDFKNTLDLPALIARREEVHWLTVSTASGMPETMGFRFFPLAEGTLALGCLDIQEQQNLRDEVLGLNRDLNDLTRQLYQANADLRGLDQLRSQFLGMAAHDLRKPIGVVMTYGGFVLDEAGAGLSEEHREFLRTCLRAATSMRDLIDGFLDLAVVESGKLQLRLAPANVAEILAGVEPIARHAAANKAVTLVLEPTEDPRRLPVDASKLQQVLLNLVGNAVEHSAAGQRVWISARWEPKALAFCVRDEGAGIAVGGSGEALQGVRQSGHGKDRRRAQHAARAGHREAGHRGARRPHLDRKRGGHRRDVSLHPADPRGGGGMTLLEELKAATLAVHTRLEAAPFFAALGAGELPLESYVGELRAFTMFHAAVERALPASRDARIAAVWREDMRKMPLLERDLRFFEPRAVADLREATEAALRATDQLTLWAAEQPLALLGVLYVLEGSTLGAKVVRPLVARAFHLNDDGGLSYLGCYGNAVAEHWRGFQERMNALVLTADERAAIVRAADEFFRADRERVSRAVSVRAGVEGVSRHVDQSRGRPARGARRSARDRGGDARGRHLLGTLAVSRDALRRARPRFSRSDAAWKAALCRYAPAQIVEQIHWLGRVLASRGMPTLLLHDQLGLLVAELTAAVPEKAADFAKLQIAADALQRGAARAFAR